MSCDEDNYKFSIFKEVYQSGKTFKNVCTVKSIEISKTNEAEWFNYWKQSGYNIVILSWIKLQRFHIDLFNKRFSKFNLNDLSAQFNSSAEIQKISTKWIRLWEQHYKEQYTKCFYNWVEASVIQNEKNLKLDNEVEYVGINQNTELTKLGLPICFGSSKMKKFKYRNSNTEREEHKIKNIPNTMSVEMNDQCFTSPISENKEVIGENSSVSKGVTSKKKRRKNKHLSNLPPHIAKDKALFKYWRKRFALFSKFEEGIQLDKESWFSVTPERIAIHISERLQNLDVIVDGFCGCGGNSIQFAKKCKKVIAIDIDPEKISMAKNNARIYNVESKIDFIAGDFLELSKNLKADGVFLSPPWGGPNYAKKNLFDIENDLQPKGASHLLKIAQAISNNIALYLPRNADIKQIISIAGNGKKVQIEHNYFGDKVVALTAFYGDNIPFNGKTIQQIKSPTFEFE